MEYTINKLSKLANVSTRTLRYYDEINLLKPLKVNESGYRIYGEREIDLLQQILFFKEFGIPLSTIKDVITNPNFDREKMLYNHLEELLNRRQQLDVLINNITKTISSIKGEIIMSDKEKFEGFKQKLINENEQKYGEEIRNKYGDSTINASNMKIKNMTEEQYLEVEKLSTEFNQTLKLAFETGDPSSELAQKACELHKKWLCYFWNEYSKEAHIGLTEMYVYDERFRKYYVENVCEGAAEFLKEAISVYFNK